MSKTVGIIGLGIMGSAISRNLVERGWRVIGFDIDAARTAELAQAGVIIAGDVAEVVREAPIVMTSLPSFAAATSVMDDIVAAAEPGCIIAELSTFSLDQKLALRDKAT